MTYKEICEFMKDKPAVNGGKARKNQLNKWRQYYDIQKDGKYYYILEEYDKDKLKINYRHGKYTTYMTDILLTELLQQDDCKLDMTYNELFLFYGFVNENFIEGKKNIDDEILRFDYKISDESLEAGGNDKDSLLTTYLYQYFQTISEMLKLIIRQNFNSLLNRNYITLSKSYKLYSENVSPYVCDKNETDLINQWRKEGLQRVGAKDYKDLYGRKSQYRYIYRDYVLSNLQESFHYDFYATDNIISLTGIGSNHSIKYNDKFTLNQNFMNTVLNSKQFSNFPPELLDQFCTRFLKLYHK